MKISNLTKFIVFTSALIGVFGAGFFWLPNVINQNSSVNVFTDKSFGWRFPKTKFAPTTGNIANVGSPPLFDVSISPGSQLAYSSIRDPGGIPRGLPVRLQIPTIGVDSVVEDALITNDGRMDVPIGSVNVAWFSLGPHPGQVGSSVIGGHFGISNGVPFVFYNLDKLKIGDKVYVLNDKGETLAFMVRAVQSFDRNADPTTVFTSGDGLAHLNLITCEGIWNQVNGTYPQRLVVFTDAIPGEGAVMVKPKPIVAVKAKLPSTAIIATPSAVPTPMLVEKIASSASQNLFSPIKSLYETPFDASITTFLILSIVFLIVKIRRR